MTPIEFVQKWSASERRERANAQEHFVDLCRVLDQPTPAQADPAGTSYTFEKGTTKLSGTPGFADVWKRGHFAWEYKGKNADLAAVFADPRRLRPEQTPAQVTERAAAEFAALAESLRRRGADPQRAAHFLMRHERALPDDGPLAASFPDFA